jgi:hypothetical protein
VGVEYIVPVDAWQPAEAEPPVPMLKGQVFHFNESPNRARQARLTRLVSLLVCLIHSVSLARSAS